MRRKWRNSLNNCRAYSTVEIDSDHRIVTASIKISLRAPTVEVKSLSNRNFQALKHDTKLQEQYNVDVKNRFSLLADNFNDQPTQDRYDIILQILEETNKKILPKKIKTKDVWVSEQSDALCRERTILRKRYRNHRNEENYRAWRDAVEVADDSFRNDQKLYLTRMCEQAEAASRLNKTSELYSIVRKISGKSDTSSANLVNKRNNEPPRDKEELLTEWASYFKDLLNVSNEDTHSTEIPAAIEDLNIDTNEFSMEELLAAIKTLKANKSPGIDSVTAEALKYGGNELILSILSICNCVLNGQDPPHQWRENIIIPIPKRPSKSMNDFRGISLMSIVTKVYNRMLLNRIYDPIDTVLRPFQAGFRKSRSCAEQIHILRRVIETFHQRQLPMIATFIDFKKAFDSVDRDTMWKILRNYGIPQKIVNAIVIIYTNSKSRVRLGNELSEAFNITTGVLQGDTLAPFLFLIVLDFVMKQTDPLC